MQQLMWEAVGLLRGETGLVDALATLRSWSASTADPATIAEHEDANLLLLAHAAATAALIRTSSLGAHHRIDDPVPENAHARPLASILESV
nr:hypothetical protein [Microbacterium barkeri]